MPQGVLPAVECANGKKYGDSYPTSRMLAMQLGYYPEDPLQAQQTDELMEAYNDLFSKIVPIHFTKDEKAKQEKLDELFEFMNNFIKTILEPILSKNKFLLGDKVTLADFWLGGIYTNYAANKEIYAPERWADTLSKFPHFKAYGERFSGEMSGYLASRPSCAV